MKLPRLEGKLNNLNKIKQPVEKLNNPAHSVPTLLTGQFKTSLNA